VRERFNPQFSLTDVVDETELADGLFSVFATRFGSGVTDFSTPFFSFDGEASGFTQVTRLGVSSTQADQIVNQDQPLGDSVSFFGTANDDTITAENVDTMIQGKGGNDTIDVSATGTDIVVFELDQASNGTDTVIGFTTGNTFQSDEIVFLGRAHLRGNGDVAETLGAGGTLGADTGFVIFSTALADTDAATLDAAFEGLAGEAAGDEIYFLAGDGTDAALARVTVTAPDDASVEILAHFNGIGDLTLLNPDNVSLPDPAIG
jgi:hypothetical protein